MIADKDEHIKTILSVIPEKPGCYQYFDENGTIIYVGKAKNLKHDGYPLISTRYMTAIRPVC